jgi:hypothetical protein
MAGDYRLQTTKHKTAISARRVITSHRRSLTIDSTLAAANEHQARVAFIQKSEVSRLKINEQMLLLGKEPVSLTLMGGAWDRTRTCTTFVTRS